MSFLSPNHVKALNNCTEGRKIGFILKLAEHLFIYLFGNVVKPHEMPRPMALTGITVRTETLHEMTKHEEKC